MVYDSKKSFHFSKVLDLEDVPILSSLMSISLPVHGSHCSPSCLLSGSGSSSIQSLPIALGYRTDVLLNPISYS